MIKTNAAPSLSLVITSYSIRFLGRITRLLESVVNQNYRDFELVYVVEGDLRLLEFVQTRLSNCSLGSYKVIYANQGIGGSASRNLGIRNSSGELIAFVDDDAILFPDWAEQVIATLTSSYKFIGIVGRVLPYWEDPKMQWLPAKFHWLVSCSTWYDYPDFTPISGHGWGSNLILRRAAFANGVTFSEAIGPKGGAPRWRVGIITEDLELVIRIRKNNDLPLIYNGRVAVWKTVEKERLSPRELTDTVLRVGMARAVTRRVIAAPDSHGSLRSELKLIRQIVNPKDSVLGYLQFGNDYGSLIRMLVLPPKVFGLFAFGFLFGLIASVGLNQ